MPVAQLPEIDTNNPLLAEWNTPHETPPFDRIRVSDYEPAFDAAIAVSRAEIDAIVNNPAKPLPVCLVFQLALPWDLCSCIHVVWGT